MAEQQAIVVGKWSLGFHHLTGGSILMLEWIDRPPLTLCFPKEQAAQIAEAIQEQQANPPPKRDRLS